MSSRILKSLPLNSYGTVSWIQIGDTHITRAGEQNEADLGKIVDEINEVYAHGGIDFVFLPGDIADNGSGRAYRAVRAHLDRLTLPWCAILGDHDVHEENFDNFQAYIESELYSAFTVGAYRFFRLNAFSQPRPDSFVVDEGQLDWLEEELLRCSAQNMQAVLLLHCYPSDLKQGNLRISELLHKYPVLLVAMGHTHYNEISNDGTVLYSATRSTGQVEEGPVGYSVTSLDKGLVSWHFVRLGSPSLVAITHPADDRLVTARSDTAASREIEVRAKIWSHVPIVMARALLNGRDAPLSSVDGFLWSCPLNTIGAEDGLHRLQVIAEDIAGVRLSSDIRITIGPRASRTFSGIDQENQIGAWAERDILGSQLGPNKNGRKW